MPARHGGSRTFLESRAGGSFYTPPDHRLVWLDRLEGEVSGGRGLHVEWIAVRISI